MFHDIWLHQAKHNDPNLQYSAPPLVKIAVGLATQSVKAKLISTGANAKFFHVHLEPRLRVAVHSVNQTSGFKRSVNVWSWDIIYMNGIKENSEVEYIKWVESWLYRKRQIHQIKRFCGTHQFSQREKCQLFNIFYLIALRFLFPFKI